MFARSPDTRVIRLLGAGVVAALLASREACAQVDSAGESDPGVLRQGWDAFRIWLASYQGELLVSLLLLWVVAIALTLILGNLTRVRVILAPAFGLLGAVVLWAAGVGFYTLLRPGAFDLPAVPWTFWIFLTLVVVLALAVPMSAIFDRANRR